jgi:hypothetical protein
LGLEILNDLVDLTVHISSATPLVFTLFISAIGCYSQSLAQWHFDKSFENSYTTKTGISNSCHESYIRTGIAKRSSAASSSEAFSCLLSFSKCIRANDNENSDLQRKFTTLNSSLESLPSTLQ